MSSSVVQLPISENHLQDLEARPPKNVRDRRLYVNRELSLLEFNERVLSQATNRRLQLLERLRFLCISRQLLDEFFEVRVAALRQRIAHGAAKPGPDGITPRNTLKRIRESTLKLVEGQYKVFHENLKPELDKQGIRFLETGQWTDRQRAWLHRYFLRELMPVLSPLGLDPAHPFPRILTKSLNFAVELTGKDAFGREGSMALVRAPRSLPRLIRIPRTFSRGPDDFVFLSSVLQTFMAELFPGMEVVGSHQFRVTRDSELLIDEEDIEDLASALRSELRDRGYAAAVRLETRVTCPPNVEKYLTTQFELTADDVYPCNGPVNLSRLTEAIDQIDRPDLKYPVLRPGVPRPLKGEPDRFDVVRRRDVLLHHPYQSFAPVLELLNQAAKDPHVLAIKQTLYRTGIDSQIVHLLIEAARAGKDVTAVIELRARFDEEANISLAARLQDAGVQVVYGVVGYKAHAKMLMIVRRERRKIRRYVHLGTGNYHSGTAAHYTDLGLISANPELGEDVHRVFQELSGLGKVLKLTHLLHSPFTLNKQLLKRIKREAANANKGKPSGIDAKLNALTDPKVIRALYNASKAGVPIRLLVRGVCSLRPGIPGISENIRVRSVLGRFLEHARVIRFENAGEPEVWCSSADWMERNLHQRVEIAFPILDPEVIERVVNETIELPWQDGMEAWDMQADGQYLCTLKQSATKGRHPQKKLLKLLG
ncbi:MAG: polyphosphate kinase 1 [Xanthomonadales bacterium]|nr:polyphosphate kinase 1 [Xanthomonadales bacterium]